MSPRPRKRSGFTLLEAVVALALIGAVSVAVLEGVGGMLRVSSTAVERNSLEVLAEDRLARVELLPALVLERLPDSLSKGTWEPLFAGLEWRAEAARVRDAGDLYQVTVTVTSATDEVTRTMRLYRPRPARADQ